MELKEIEHKIACNEINAVQVFTQMKQYISKTKEPESDYGLILTSNEGEEGMEACDFDTQLNPAFKFRNLLFSEIKKEEVAVAEKRRYSKEYKAGINEGFRLVKIIANNEFNKENDCLPIGLRDSIAISVMNAIIVGNNADDSALGTGAALDAYEVADNMIKVR